MHSISSLGVGVKQLKVKPLIISINVEFHDFHFASIHLIIISDF